MQQVRKRIKDMANFNPFKKKNPMQEFKTSVAELGVKSWKKIPSKVKFGLGVAGIAAGGVGVLAASIALSPQLKKSDPKYKALKKAGYL
jgi:hypothetical protein